MAKTDARKIAFDVDEERRVSGLLIHPKGARALYVLAHGAGAGMTHPFMTRISDLLADRGIATLRYQFPYMEKGSGRPDSPKVAEATVRAAVGFPLHPPGAPADTRAAHLSDVGIPMLFLQGTRDEFADLGLLKPLVGKLGSKATLHLIPDANHSFRVPAKTGRKEADVMAELADTLAGWIDKALAA
jgi:predicted alpha/beta-hydrolase family hydrolase